MDDFTILLLGGVLLIVVGLLVKRFPMLIAGYNTMPPAKKKNVDIGGLSSFMRRHLVIMRSFMDPIYGRPGTDRPDGHAGSDLRNLPACLTSFGCSFGHNGTTTTENNERQRHENHLHSTQLCRTRRGARPPGRRRHAVPAGACLVPQARHGAAAQQRPVLHPRLLAGGALRMRAGRTHQPRRQGHRRTFRAPLLRPGGAGHRLHGPRPATAGHRRRAAVGALQGIRPLGGPLAPIRIFAGAGRRRAVPAFHAGGERPDAPAGRHVRRCSSLSTGSSPRCRST